MWWEEDGLCVEDVDGQVFFFKGAYIKDFDFDYNNDNDDIKVERVKVDYENPIDIKELFDKEIKNDK